MQGLTSFWRGMKKAGLMNFFVYCLAWPLLMILSRIPPLWAVGIGKYAGTLAFLLSRKHRDVSLLNLRTAFPMMRPAERWDIALRSFQNVGKTFVEFPGLLRRGERELLESVRFVGYESVMQAWKEGKGVLFLTGHLGNWEIMALAQGYTAPPRLALVARPLDNPYLERWVSRIRRRSGNRIIEKRGALRQVLRSLREGFAVGMLMDQSTTGKEGLFVDFFSHPAGSSAAVAYLAVRCGARIVPAYCIRESKERMYTIHTDPALEVLLTGRKEADVFACTQQCQKVLEDIIRKHPDQWFWMHRRWKWSPTVCYAGKGSEFRFAVHAYGKIGGMVDRRTGLPL